MQRNDYGKVALFVLLFFASLSTAKATYCVSGTSCAAHPIGYVCCNSPTATLTCGSSPRNWGSPGVCPKSICIAATCSGGSPVCGTAYIAHGTTDTGCSGNYNGCNGYACHCSGTGACEAACTDNDGNMNPYTRGTMDAAPSGPGGEATDYCQTTQQVVEYYCLDSGAGTSTFASCPTNYFCTTGACTYCAGCNYGGACYPGNTNSYCGSGGAPCSTCGQVCYLQACCTPNCVGKCGGASNGCGGTCTAACPSPQVCNVQTCCTPTTCASLGKSCGSWPNGCGTNLNCGTCNDYNFCTSDVCSAAGACIYTAYCTGSDTSCGCSSCTNCNLNDAYVGGYFCSSGDVYQVYRNYYCSGTSCTYSDSSLLIQDCGANVCCNGGCCAAGQICQAAGCIAAYNAQFVSQSVSPVMTIGQQYSVSVTMKNTGGNTWTQSNNYKLGSQNPQDNSRWSVARALLGASDAIATGQSKAFSFTVTAPATAGTYNFQWRMLQEAVTWFGDFSTNLAVCVASTCASLGKQCSSWPDGCSGTLNCGACINGYSCSSGSCVCPGCLSGGYCYAGNTSTLCGAGGIACQACSSGQVCSGGTCVVGTEVCSTAGDENNNGECDYDSSTCSHGDIACPVGITAISVTNANPIAGSSINVSCTSTRTGVNSIIASIDGVGTCSWGKWNGNVAIFSCPVGAAYGTRTARCWVNTAKSYQTGTNMTYSINVLASTCSVYASSSSCIDDTRCNWCSSCSGTKYTGGSDRCVEAGSCPAPYCWTGQCGAECDPTNYVCNDKDSCSSCPGCSYSDYYCTANCGCDFTSNNPDSLQAYCAGCSRNWVAGGEGTVFGEYNPGTITACCGDDSGEYYQPTDAGTQNICCNAASDCAINSLCVASGSADTTNNYCCYSNSNADGTKETCATYSNGATCFSNGVNTCNALSGWACSYTTTTCTSSAECTGLCGSKKCVFTDSGIYNYTEPTTETNCADGHDNNCNNERDYDGKDTMGSYVSKGDASCPVAVNNIATVSSVCPSAHLNVNCTLSVAGVGSTTAFIGASQCSLTKWVGSVAVFDCVAPSSAGSVTAQCSIDTTKSYQTGTDKTATVSVGGTNCCSAYSNQPGCEADSVCEWCVSCDAMTRFSGNPSAACVRKGSCTYSCKKDSCSAKCDGSNGCNPLSTCDLATCECVCGDSDGGKNYNVAGTTSLGLTTNVDSCTGSTLTEYYCEANAIKSESYNCLAGWGCVSGACVPPQCTAGSCCDQSTRPYKFYPAGYMCDPQKVCSSNQLCQYTVCDSTGNCNQLIGCSNCAGQTKGQCGIATGACITKAGDDDCAFTDSASKCVDCSTYCDSSFTCTLLPSQGGCNYRYDECVAAAKPGGSPSDPVECPCHNYWTGCLP
ncbi:MAG: hypothetical protein V1837_08205 [Candidatus Woesearchaeota archaeon]